MFYRENRFQVESEKTKVIFDDQTAFGKLINVSRWGMRIKKPSTLPLTIGGIVAITVSIEGFPIYEGEALILNVFKEGACDVGLKLFNDGANIPYLQAIINRSLYQIKDIDTDCDIDSNFKSYVTDLIFLLQTIKNEMESSENYSKIASDNYESKLALDKLSIDKAMDIFGLKLSKEFAKVGDKVVDISNERLLKYRTYFQRVIHPYMLSAPFVQRSYEKPLGYAGDFGLMAMLYQYEDIGKSLFARFLHRWSCEEPAAIANKNRVKLLQEIMIGHSKGKESYKAAVVACGPCREIELFVDHLNQSRSEVKFTAICIDQEEKALDYARTRIYPKIASSSTKDIKFMKEDAVLGLIKGREPLISATLDSDIIISAGLFDYLSDRLASRLISSLYDQLMPGGILIIGNVSKSNPCVFSMTYVTEWELVLRSADDLASLVTNDIKCSAHSIEIIEEETGLNLFLKIIK